MRRSVDIILLSRAGTLLYGSQWHKPLSEKLSNKGEYKYSEYDVHRWVNGADTIPMWVWDRLYDILGNKKVAIGLLMIDLEMSGLVVK